MGHSFESRDEAEVAATPEQVWGAIATGPGIDSWFMGRTEVEPGEGGTVNTFFGGYTPSFAVTAWEPGERLAYGSGEAPDGRFVAYEFLVEGRAGGSTTLRVVTSGFLPGDDWADEFEAMTKGNELFFRTLVTYLGHFAGRTATPVTVFGPSVTDWPAAWTALRRAAGLGDNPAAGDPASFTVGGRRIEGHVYCANSQTLGIVTPGGMYRFLQGFDGAMIAGHHLFSTVDTEITEQAWHAWLAGTLSGKDPQ